MIDLRTCVKGDILITRDGNYCQYLSLDNDYTYSHLIKYISGDNTGSQGSRTDKGETFFKDIDDNDIIHIIRKSDYELLKTYFEPYTQDLKASDRVLVKKLNTVTTVEFIDNEGIHLDAYYGTFERDELIKL